jgi:hypothetical protein
MKTNRPLYYSNTHSRCWQCGYFGTFSWRGEFWFSPWDFDTYLSKSWRCDFDQSFWGTK